MEQPRRAWRLKRLASEHRDDLLLLRVDPPISFQDEHGFESRPLHQVIVASRFREEPLFPITQWPVHVYVLESLVPDPERRDRLQKTEYQLVAWAELYPTEEDARRKSSG